MTDTLVGDAVAFPQDEGFGGIGDGNERWSSAGYFAGLARMVGTSGFVDAGLTFSGHDGGADTVDLDPGRCFVVAQPATMGVDVQSAVGGTAEPAYDTTLQGAIPLLVGMPSGAAGLDLQDSTPSAVWVAYDNDGSGPGSAGSVYVRSDDTGGVSAPSHPSVKIGEADPDNSANDTRANDNPSETFQSITAEELVGNADRIVTSETELRDALNELAKDEKQTIRIGEPFDLSDFVDIDGWDDLTIAGQPGSKTTINIEDGGTSGHFNVGLNTACGDVRFRWLDLDGNKPNVSSSSKEDHASAVYGYNADSIEFSHGAVRRIQSNGGSDNTTNSTGITVLEGVGDAHVHHSYFDDCANRPVESACTSLYVHGNTFINNRERNVSLSCVRRTGYVTQRSRVHDNEHVVGTGGDLGSHIAMHGTDYDGDYGNGEGLGDPVETINIHDETMVGGKRMGIALRQIAANSGSIDIHDNEIKEATNGGIRVTHQNNVADDTKVLDVAVKIHDNTLGSLGGGQGIWVHSYRSAKVHDNTIKSTSSQSVIVLENSPKSEANRNNITDSGQHGVVLISDRARAEGNTIDTVANVGVNMSGGDDQTVRDNNIYNAGTGTGGAHGISAFDGTGHNIRGNEIDGEGTTNRGVNLGVDGVVVAENVFRNVSTAIGGSSTPLDEHDNVTR